MAVKSDQHGFMMPAEGGKDEIGDTRLDTGIPALLRRMNEIGLSYKDLNTRQSSLEDIFVSLVSDRASGPA